MDLTMQIFNLLAKANGFNEMPDEKKLETIKEINFQWDELPENKMNCNEKSILAIFLIDPFLKFKLFNEAEKWINILLSDRNDDKTQYGIYNGMLRFEKGDYNDAYKYFDMSYKDSGERSLKERDPKYLDFYKNPEKYLKN